MWGEKNYDELYAELSGKRHGGKVEATGGQAEGGKQLLSAMVISYDEKART